MRKRQPSFTAALLWWLVAVIAAGVAWRVVRDGRLGRFGKSDNPLLQLARPLLGGTDEPTASTAPNETGVDEATVPALLPDSTRTSVASAELLHAAVANLSQQRALAARVRQRIDLFDQPLSGAGIYQQWGRGQEHRRTRLELKLQVAGQTASLQQICDGRFLWERRDILGTVTLSRIDLQRVRQAVEADAAAPADAFQHWLALGGLSQLIAGLEKHFEFGPAEPGRLGKLPVWVLEGQWRAESLARFLPGPAEPASAAPAAAARLPTPGPPRVRLVLGADENIPLFPYRVEYLRRSGPATGQGGGPWISQATLELFEVQLAAKLEPDAFTYDPGNQEVIDRTQLFLRQLRGEAPTVVKPRPLD